MPADDRRPAEPSARRARRRAAGGGRGAARSGLHPRRRRHRQDPGGDPPDRLPGARRAGRAAARARGDVHHPGRRRAAGAAARPRRRGRAGADLPLRGAAPAAVLLAADLRRVRARRWSRASSPAIRAAAGTCRLSLSVGRAARPRLARSSGRRRRWSSRTTTSPAPARRTGEPPLAARRRRAGLRGVRVGQRRPRPARLRGPAAADGRRDRERPADRGRGARALPPLHGRRVPGRLAAAAAAARRLARRPRRPVRRRRPEPDHLLVHRRLADVPAGVRASGSPARPSCGWSATTARPTRSSPSPTGSIPDSRLQAQAGDGPEPTFDVVRRRAGRGGRRRARGSRRCASRACRCARWRSCTGSTRSRRSTRRRCRPPASPTCCAAGSGSSSGPRCARRSCCCAARRARPPTTTPQACVRDRHRRAVRARVHAPSRRAAPAPPATAGSRCARSSGWPRSSPRPTRSAGIEEFVAELAARADAQHAPPVEGVTLASLHSAKGLEWDAVFLVGLVDGTAADHACDDAGAGRGGAPAALRRRHPRPPTPGAVLGARARGRRPAVTQAVASSSTASARSTLPPDAAARRPSAGCPTTRSCSGCGTGGCSARATTACRRTSCSTTRRSRRSRRARPRDRAELAAVPGVGPKKLEQYADEVLALLDSTADGRAIRSRAVAEELERAARRSSISSRSR